VRVFGEGTIVAALVHVLCFAPIVGGAQQPVRIADRLSCPSCRIVERSRIELRGAPESVFDLAPLTVTLDSAGRYWAAVLTGAPVAFGKDGRFLRSLGGSGRGPGEYLSPSVVVPFRSDSLLVFDLNGMRTSVLDSGLRVVATAPVSWMIGLFVSNGRGSIVATSLAATPANIGWPLHALRREAHGISIARSFGPGDGSFDGSGRASAALTFALGNARQGYWACAPDRIACSLRGWDGAISMQFERWPEWFREPSRMSAGGPSMPPSPSVKAISEDGSGRVWVVSLVPSPHWKSAWTSSARPGAEISARLLDASALFDAIIEVIDVRSRRVVTRHRTSEQIIGALPGGRVIVYHTDDTGRGGVRIVQLEVVQ
jgi:hypothetical protein